MSPIGSSNRARQNVARMTPRTVLLCTVRISDYAHLVRRSLALGIELAVSRPGDGCCTPAPPRVARAEPRHRADNLELPQLPPLNPISKPQSCQHQYRQLPA